MLTSGSLCAMSVRKFVSINVLLNRKQSIGLHFKLIDCFYKTEFLLEDVFERTKDVIRGKENNVLNNLRSIPNNSD